MTNKNTSKEKINFIREYYDLPCDDKYITDNLLGSIGSAVYDIKIFKKEFRDALIKLFGW